MHREAPRPRNDHEPTLRKAAERLRIAAGPADHAKPGGVDGVRQHRLARVPGFANLRMTPRS